MKRWINPIPGKVLHLFLEFLQKKALPRPPLGVETHSDGHGEGWLGQDVCQGTAVQVVSEHVLTVLVCVQLPRSKHLAEDCFLVGEVNVVWSFSTSIRFVEQLTVFGIP